MNDDQTASQQAATQAAAQAQAYALQAQQLTQYAAHDLKARYNKQTPRDTLTFGSGFPVSQTLSGNPQDAFHGLTIVNPTTMSIRVGFGAGGTEGPIVVGPGKGIAWPAEYADVTFSVNARDAERAAASILVLRLWYPPMQPDVFEYGADAIIYNVATGSSEQERTPTKWIALPLAGESLAASTAKTLWTPETGKRFRLMGYVLSASTSAHVLLKDEGTAFTAAYLAANTAPATPPAWSNGYLSTTAGNILKIEAGTATTVYGAVFGTEE